MSRSHKLSLEFIWFLIYLIFHISKLNLIIYFCSLAVPKICTLSQLIWLLSWWTASPLLVPWLLDCSAKTVLLDGLMLLEIYERQSLKASKCKAAYVLYDWTDHVCSSSSRSSIRSSSR